VQQDQALPCFFIPVLQMQTALLCGAAVAVAETTSQLIRSVRRVSVQMRVFIVIILSIRSCLETLTLLYFQFRAHRHLTVRARTHILKALFACQHHRRALCGYNYIFPRDEMCRSLKSKPPPPPST
jgi:hypothetical protein